MTETEERHPFDWYPDEEMPAAVQDMLASTEKIEWHSAAALLPMMGDAELADLAEDIRQHGLRMPVTMHEGKILDGRNRWRACEIAGVEPRTVQWNGEGGSAVLWVLSVNVKRRHLTESQRAMIAAEMLPMLEAEAKERQVKLAGTRPNVGQRRNDDLVADLPQGPKISASTSICPGCGTRYSENNHICKAQPTSPARQTDPAPRLDVRPKLIPTTPQAPRAPLSRDRAAAVVGVSSRSVADAKIVAKKAPELAEQVREGKMSLGAAAHKVRAEEKQTKAAEQIKEAPRVDVRIEVGDATALPMESETVDVVLTSPPYGLEKPYHGQSDLARGWETFMADWLSEAYRVARSPGRLILNVPLDTAKGGFRPTWAEACMAAVNAGWTYRAAILWDKMNSTKGNRGLGSENSADAPYPVAEVEVVGLFSKGLWKLGDDRPSDITPSEWQAWGNGLWQLPGESRGWEGHPAPFPEELVRRLLLYLTRVGDTILDPFSGSGTTSLVAWRHKRIPIGFDLSEVYVASARRRIANEQETMAREIQATARPDLGLFTGASR